MKRYGKWAASVMVTAILLAGCGPDGAEEPSKEKDPVNEVSIPSENHLPDNESSDEGGEQKVEETKQTAEKEGNGDETDAGLPAYEKLKDDERMLSKSYLEEMRTGVMPDTGGLKIGSTMEEVKAQLGEPKGEDTYEGAFYHDYGDLVVYYQYPDGREVLRIDRKFKDPQVIANVTDAWGMPDYAEPIYPESEEQMLIYEGPDVIVYIEVGGTYGNEAHYVVLHEKNGNRAVSGE